jgi:TatD DNase family protein
MFSESHCHLDVEGFEAVRVAVDAGVRLVLTCGIDVDSSREAVKTAERFEIVKGCVGIHPWRADLFDSQSIEQLRNLLDSRDVVAISEIGLDYAGRRTLDWVFTEEYVRPEIQRDCFVSQLQLAAEEKLPVLVHDRTRDGEVLETMGREGNIDRGAAIHGFGKDVEYALECVDRGIYLSIGKRSIESRSQEIIKTIGKVPLEFLLTETDTNEPVGVLTVAKKIAEIKGTSMEEVGVVTTRNLEKLIGQ